MPDLCCAGRSARERHTSGVEYLITRTKYDPMDLNVVLIVLSTLVALITTWNDYKEKKLRVLGIVLTVLMITLGVVTFSQMKEDEAEQIQHHQEIVGGLDRQLKEVDALSAKLNERLQDQIMTMQAMDNKMDDSERKLRELSDRMDKASGRIDNFMTRLQDFDNRLNNEVLEVWVVTDAGFQSQPSVPNLSMLEFYLKKKVPVDSGATIVFEKRVGAFRAEVAMQDSGAYTLLKLYDFTDMDWIHPGVALGVANWKDFDKAVLVYSRKKAASGGDLVEEFVRIKVVKSFPGWHFLRGKKDHLLFSDFVNTELSINYRNHDKLNPINSIRAVTIYLVGREKMKKLEYFASYRDPQFVTDAEAFKIRGIRIDSVLFSNAPLELRQNIPDLE